MTDDSPPLAFLVGESLTVGGATLDRNPARSSATVTDGAIVFDVPGLFRFKRAEGASYYEAVAFDARAVPMVHTHREAGGPPRDPRAGLRQLVIDPRCTETLLARTIEAEPTTDRPGTGEAGGLLPFDDF